MASEKGAFGPRAIQILLATSGLVTGVSAPALAQEQAERQGGIGEIVITAERRESTVLDTPVAVTALTGETRDLLGINDQQDLALFTPSLSFTESPNRLSIRGFGRLNNALGNDPGVATYEDGFYTSETAALATSSISTDRIEVLRGPQGTLYGRNSVGGAANVISVRPSDTWTGEVRLGTNDFGLKQVEAAISGPISESIRFRIDTTLRDQEEGFTENIVGEDVRTVGDWYIKAQLEWDITDNFSAWFRYSHLTRGFAPGTQVAADGFRDESFTLTSPFTLNNGQVIPAGTVVSPRQLALTPNAELGLPENLQARSADLIALDFDNKQGLDDNHQFITHLTYDFAGTSVKYIGGYSQYYFYSYTDLDNTGRGSFVDPVTNITVDTFGINETIEDKSWYSHELQWLSTDEGAWDWIVGAFYYHEDITQPFTNFAPNNISLRSPVTVAATGPTAGQAVAAAPNPRGINYFQEGRLIGKAWAAYVQTSYDFLPNWTLTTGLRYSFDEKDGEENQRQVVYSPYRDFAPLTAGRQDVLEATINPGTAAGVSTAPGTRVPVAGPGATRQVFAEWDGVTGRVNLDWRPNDTTLIYANVNKGYKSGGFKLGQYDQQPLVGEESVWAYELGYKASFARQFQLTAAAFYNDFEGLQLPVTISNNGVLQRVFVNAEKAFSRGVELEATWAPTRAFQLLGVYSFLDTEVEEGPLAQDVVRGGFQPTAGNKLVRAPEHRATLNGIYTLPFMGGDLSFVGTVSYTGSQYYEIFSIDFYEGEAFTRVDGRARWESGSGRYVLTGGVRNATDEEVINGVLATTAIPVTFVPGQPNAGNLSALPAGVTAIPAGQTFAGNGPDQGGARRQVNYNEPRVYTLELQVRF